MQQACRARRAKLPPLTPKVQLSLPGRALLSRLSCPPVSTTTALPAQTVPRASANSSRPPVLEARPCANQAAGAKATSATTPPSNSPAAHQRFN